MYYILFHLVLLDAWYLWLISAECKMFSIFTRACQEIALAVPPLGPIPTSLVKTNIQGLISVFAWPLGGPT